MFTGFIVGHTGTGTPSGYLECDGSAVSRTTYADLFAVIGTTWGAGDGSSTFNLPDLRGRAAIGVGTGPTLTNRALGNFAGQEQVQLETSELPSHTHQPSGDAVLRYTSSGGQYAMPLQSGNDVTLGITVPATGSNEHHENMMPWLALRMLIKT